MLELGLEELVHMSVGYEPVADARTVRRTEAARRAAPLIVIAHRISSALRSDRIMLLDNQGYPDRHARYAAATIEDLREPGRRLDLGAWNLLS